MKIKYLSKKDGHLAYSTTLLGNSDAIYFPLKFNKATVQISEVTSGEAIVQYSLNDKDKILSDTGHWYDWSSGIAVPLETKGMCIDSPISFLRVKTHVSTKYKIEILI